VQIVPMQPMPISASDIRQRAARREDLSAMLPRDVANYITTNRLYS
jgi:nicotinic acid mononucleotide adenylyltransferase